MALGGPNIYPGIIGGYSYIPPRCETCGADIADQELHREWHEDLERRLLAIPQQE